VKTKPRISKQKAISEIVKGLRKGYSREDILASIGVKWQIATRTFDRYFSEAQETHSKEQQELERLAREQLLQTKKEELKSEIISIQERKEYLTKIVTAKTDLIQVGKATVEVLTHDDGRREIITNDIRIRALQELNKMDGAYTPTQFEDVTERKPLHEIFTFIDNNNDKDK
jgi:hypothetical protein